MDIIFDLLKKSQFDIYLDTLSDCEAYIITFSRSIGTYLEIFEKVRSKKNYVWRSTAMIFFLRRVPDS
jgi:hypothetical protein